MYEAYRVLRKFQWDGWIYAPFARLNPPGNCQCDCSERNIAGDPITGSKCTGIVGTSCICEGTLCHCTCGIKSELYGGDIWVVMAGHPRKEMILDPRMAVQDQSIPSIDDLLKESEYKRLTGLPSDVGAEPEPKTRKARTATPA